VHVGADGTYIYTPAHGFVGTDTFTYSVTDGKVTVEKTVTVTVHPTNATPVVRDDTVTTKSGQPVTVNVLANDSDPDGDPLKVTAVSASAGLVSVNADGSLKYVPPQGFSGGVTLTYWVADGEGGHATAHVFVNVTGDDVVVQEPVPSSPVIERPDDTPPGMIVNGAVIDAVHNIHGLGSIAGSIGAHGVIVTAANAIDSLDGNAEFGAGIATVQRGALDKVRLQQIGETFDVSTRAGNLNSWDVRGATGFSLRFNIGASDISSGDRVSLILESVVRDRTLIVQFTGLVSDTSAHIVEYRVMQADGKPLPAWMERVGKDLVAGKWPVDQDIVDLKVIALLSDGTTITRDVHIQTNTGEIQPLEQQCTREHPRMFSDQLRARPMGAAADMERLRLVIGR
jgi:Bacterial Ig domain